MIQTHRMIWWPVTHTHCIIVDAYSMPDDTLINSLQSEINTDYDIKITGRYMESKNDIIKSCLNQIDTTEQKHL